MHAAETSHAVTSRRLVAPRSQDTWLSAVAKYFERNALWFILLISIISSIAATTYYFAHNDILAYNDSRSHINIARSVIDSKTPGVTQLGGVWLPFPHILMLPFVANNYLWHTGLAGSIVAMIAYVISTFFIFKIVRLLTDNAYASFAAALMFVVNPNVLYMQSTPMSELPLLATTLFGSYFFIAWLRYKRTVLLVIAALGVMLATLSRYEAWLVLLVCTAIIITESTSRGRLKKEGEGNAVLFLTLGSLGIALWFLWNLLIFGDPLYFFDGPYSAAAQQKQLAAMGDLPTKHNFILSLSTIVQAISLNVGTVILAATVISIGIILAIRARKQITLYAILILAAPILLDFITLVQGSIIITTTIPDTFNLRYGLMSIPLIVVVIALAMSKLKIPKIASVALALCLTVASASAIPALIKYDATIGAGSANNGTGGNAKIALENTLKSEYKGGGILASMYSFNPVMQQIGLPLRDYVYEGNYHIWPKALTSPQTNVRYVMMYAGHNSGDAVYLDYVKRRDIFTRYYRVAFDQDGYELLVRRSSD